MSTNAAFTPAVSRFDQALARHLASRAAEGAAFDEPTVRQCYIDTFRDLQLARQAANASSIEELEGCFVQKVSEMMTCHRRFIRGMPEAIASTFIAELLNDKPWYAAFDRDRNGPLVCTG